MNTLVEQGRFAPDRRPIRWHRGLAAQCQLRTSASWRTCVCLSALCDPGLLRAPIMTRSSSRRNTRPSASAITRFGLPERAI